MISSLLIANRGEIARRIIRTARRLGVRTVAVYSEADAEAAHVREADQAVAIGPAAARESYLVGKKIIAAARETGAEAIHPGYGFLSENAAFAEAVTKAGLIWVGPPPAAIRAMGLKDSAKRLMAEAGVPVTPGYLGEDQSEARLLKEAKAIGWPMLIKAVAGGGGKGMRRVDAEKEFAAALGAAKREAAGAFGDDRVLLEKYAASPRHIEVQVFGDTHGNAVHLFERDCSLQRRHQKVIEEAPAPGMDAATRAAVCEAAVKAAKAVNYVGAGTVEFIADASDGLRADRIWFMEINTRLQVEHPVTEAVTGLDLVEWQLRVASGEPLPLTQDKIKLRGWAMEARLYAENPASGFLPSTGPLDHFRLPEDVRADSAVEQGDKVSPHYDPMIAKLIVHAKDRKTAAKRLAGACAAVEVWPVKTNAAFLARCAAHPDFVKGAIDTGFIDARLEALTADEIPDDVIVAGFALAASTSSAMDWKGIDGERDPWAANPDGAFGFRLNGQATSHQRMEIDGRPFSAKVRPMEPGSWVWMVDWGGQIRPAAPVPGAVWFSPRYEGEHLSLIWTHPGGVLFKDGAAFEVTRARAGAADEADAVGDGAIRSPMPGKIASVAVKAGDQVAKGQALVTLEAMKMEHTLVAPFDGTVAEIAVTAGQQTAEGVVLARLERVN